MVAPSALLDRHALVATARALIGVPFQHQGRGAVQPDTSRQGVDCIGLIFRIAWEVGIPLQDVTGYPTSTNGAWLTAECQRQLDPVPLAEAVPGDLVQWADPTTREPCNLALLADGGQPYSLIHPLVKFGMVVEHGYTKPWPDWVVAAWRFRGPLAPWLPLTSSPCSSRGIP